MVWRDNAFICGSVKLRIVTGTINRKLSRNNTRGGLYYVSTIGQFWVCTRPFYHIPSRSNRGNKTIRRNVR
jgi:hypothetical protein